MVFKAILVILTWTCGQLLNGQTIIWQENFNSYADGTGVGANNNTVNPDADWFTGGCTSCVDTADWWEVRSGWMEARDVNQVVYIQSEVVNIASFTNVGFSIEISEFGDLEGPYFLQDHCEDQEKEDFVNVFYRVDGGAWKLIRNYLDWCGLYDSCASHTLYGDDGGNSGDCRDSDQDWDFAKISRTGLSGTTLELRIEAINSATTEYISIDNLQVEGTIVLPVTLKSFKISAVDGAIKVDWQTVSESNNDFFTVQRTRRPGSNKWESLDSIGGKTLSQELTNYSYMDSNPYPGISYYRLKQVDLDGTTRFFPIESIRMPTTREPYPNPVGNNLYIEKSTSHHPLWEINLLDLTAKPLNVPLSDGKEFVQLDVSGLPSGSYILTYGTKRYKIQVLR